MCSLKQQHSMLATIFYKTKSSSENKHCSSISSIHLLELFVMVVIGGFFIIWPLAVIGWGWCCGWQRRPQSKELNVFVYTKLQSHWWNRSWTFTYPQDLVSLCHPHAVALLWALLCVCGASAVRSCPRDRLRKAFADLEISHLMLSTIKLQYI